LTVVTMLVREFLIAANVISIGKPVESIAFNPDGTEIATVSSNGLQIWSVTDHRLVTSFGDQWGSPLVAWSRDGQLLATQGPAFTIRIWRVATGQQIVVLSGHSDSINSIVWSADGMMLVSGSDDHTVRLWDIARGSVLYVLRHHTDQVTCVALSPDGQIIASGSVDRSIQFWRVSSGQLVQSLSTHQIVSTIAFSPDGLLLAAGVGNMVDMFRVSDGVTVKRFDHADWVNSLVFSPDGRFLATGTGIKDTEANLKKPEIRLWNTNDGRLVKIWSGNYDAVTSVVFSPDGHILASGSWDGVVQLWQVETIK
jgi:WD40 repeat protein